MMQTMLDFIRKYQRYFFIVVSIFVIGSFCFFGINTQGGPNVQKVKDVEVGKAYDGSKLMRSEIDQLTRMFGANFFNDGVVEKDFLETGMGLQLMLAHWDAISEDIETRFERFQKFKPYRHPSAPFLGVEAMWQQVLPEQKETFDAFKVASCDRQGLELLTRLCTNETRFPPSLMRRFLLQMQQQYSWVPRDPELERGDLTLFRCKTASDWFGPRFVELVAEFIHNSALVAKEQGYSVSREEARVDLFQNAAQLMQSKGASQEEAPEMIRQQFLMLGMSEAEAIKTWQKVLLFRRLFNDYGHSCMLDTKPFKQFFGFASKSTEVDLYTLPVKLADFDDVMQLQMYIDQVTSKKQTMHPLDLPTTFLKPEKVGAKELVQKRYFVEMARVDKAEVALSVPLAETWDWELKHFALLKQNFAELKGDKKPFDALEQVDASVRMKIDDFARLAIVDEKPEMIKQALEKAALEKTELTIPLAGPMALVGLENRGELLAKLEKGKTLDGYTQDQQNFYRIHVIDESPDLELMTFQQAAEQGVLSRLVDSKLQKAYESIRTQTPTLFQDEKGEWKAFADAKLEVGRTVYKDLVKTVGVSGRDLNQVVKDRLVHPMKTMLAHLQQGHEHLVRTSSEKPLEGLKPQINLADQWLLDKSSVTLKLSEKTRCLDMGAFTKSKGDWSGVVLNSSGQPTLYHVKEQLAGDTSLEGKIQSSQNVLAKDAKRYLMAELLERFTGALD